jgi:hypothetical protein
MVERAAGAVPPSSWGGIRMDRSGWPSPVMVGDYTRLFLNRSDVAMTFTATGHWSWRKQSLTPSWLSSALAGMGSLGLASVSVADASKWIRLDLDDDAQADRLFRIVEALSDPRSAVLESSRRGFHLLIFVRPAPRNVARRWGFQLAREAGLDAIELFPKSGGLNGVPAPLIVHLKDGRIHPLIDAQTGELVVDPRTPLTARRPTDVPGLTPPGELIDRSWRTGRTDQRELVAEIERYTELRFYGPERAIGRINSTPMPG